MEDGARQISSEQICEWCRDAPPTAGAFWLNGVQRQLCERCADYARKNATGWSSARYAWNAIQCASKMLVAFDAKRKSRPFLSSRQTQLWRSAFWDLAGELVQRLEWRKDQPEWQRFRIEIKMPDDETQLMELSLERLALRPIKRAPRVPKVPKGNA